ncbi:protein kinase domain-containing protein [Reyranella sp.]|uniref:protein kinase domain-containing protein n=1 Tax=Reyranella sp. TaxID=1929291 RepID=UPI0037832F2C
MSSDNVQALPPGTQLGDYRFDAVIGQGGFGITYRAFDTQLAKFVAIKEYLPVEFAIRREDGQVAPRGARFAEDFTWGRDRFLDEARALARFRHPHIVPVLRYFEANGTAYTVMEFEDGKNLAELLRDPARPLSPDNVQRLAEALLSGLRAVHAENFLHRDVKPSNIIVRRDGVPVLIDFGAARQAIGGRTRTLTSVLTPQYAPIEQYALDAKQGPWSDIYSAAAVLHHAITGRPPADAAARVGADPYRPLASTEEARFDPVFLAAIDRALAFAPADRPQNVAAWRALFAPAKVPAESVPSAPLEDIPTERVANVVPVMTPRLGGAVRETGDGVPEPRRKSRAAAMLAGVSVIAIAVAAWRFQTDIRQLFAGQPTTAATTAMASSPPQAATPATPAATPSPAAKPPAVPATPVTAQPASRSTPQPDLSAAQKALIDQAHRAALGAALALERAEEAARAARSLAGEARIVAARAARPDLEKSERLSYDGGTSYIGQTESGRRQGLGVAELANGERQAGEWAADRLNGLGTVKFADDVRYAGQWRDGKSTGLGLREKPGSERSEGNFVDGRLEGLAIRRTLTAPNKVQSGEFRAGLLEGPGVEQVSDGERYEGMFRNGQRNGYGEAISADGKMIAGRWSEGKLVESTP